MDAIGPVPFCGMLLADMGAEVIRVDRARGGGAIGRLADVCGRGKRSIAVDLKAEEGRRLLLRLAATADVLIEGLRPGVAERLGIGPEDVAAVNPRLVYGRMTGWGQEGPMAHMAGHDINYIGLVGALHAIGNEAPVPPLNLVGDYGGGALYLALGVVAALLERQTSGLGQVVDAAMVDGAASLMTPTYQLAAMGLWTDARNSNLLDGRAPFYRAYETADGGYMAVGAIEPQFYAELLELLGLDANQLPAQLDRSGWPEIAKQIAAAFLAAPRRHWEEVFAGSDACATPVLSLEEAPAHDHNRSRDVFSAGTDGCDPAPAPRFSRTPTTAETAAPRRGADTSFVLADLGIDTAESARLATAGVVMAAEL
jgi:alpha-methylacyl-CoA racemase